MTKLRFIFYHLCEKIWLAFSARLSGRLAFSARLSGSQIFEQCCGPQAVYDLQSSTTARLRTKSPIPKGSCSSYSILMQIKFAVGAELTLNCDKFELTIAYFCHFLYCSIRNLRQLWLIITSQQRRRVQRSLILQVFFRNPEASRLLLQ